MTKFVLVLFGDEKRGSQGLSALEGLQNEATISLCGAALIERDEQGLLLLRRSTGGELLEGGLGATVARAPSELLEFVMRDLTPKTFALIAELQGDSTSIGARMEPLDGKLVREWRAPARDEEAPSGRAPRTR